MHQFPWILPSFYAIIPLTNAVYLNPPCYPYEQPAVACSSHVTSSNKKSQSADWLFLLETYGNSQDFRGRTPRKPYARLRAEHPENHGFRGVFLSFDGRSVLPAPADNAQANDHPDFPAADAPP